MKNAQGFSTHVWIGVYVVCIALASAAVSHIVARSHIQRAPVGIQAATDPNDS